MRKKENFRLVERVVPLGLIPLAVAFQNSEHVSVNAKGNALLHRLHGVIPKPCLSNAVDSSKPLKALLLQGGMDVISGSAGIGVSPKNRTLLCFSRFYGIPCGLHQHLP